MREENNAASVMRLSVEHNSGAATPAPLVGVDATAPNLSFLTQEFAEALRSFFDTVDRVTAVNTVPTARLLELAGKAGRAPLTDTEIRELQTLKAQAFRQGRAVGAVIGFFLKFKPYAALEEIRRKGQFFQPAFGPVLVVEGEAVRDVLERDQEFTVEPYGVEMMKVMSPAHNGGFSTFILSTDDNAVYEPDKRLLTAVCNRQDADSDHRRRSSGLRATRRRRGRRRAGHGSSTIDVVPAARALRPGDARSSVSRRSRWPPSREPSS